MWNWINKKIKSQLPHQQIMLPVLGSILLIFVLLLLPTGYEGARTYQDADRCRARVLEVDDSSIVDTGLIRSGEQRCMLELENGRFAGRSSLASTCYPVRWSPIKFLFPATGLRWWSATVASRF